MPANEHFGQCLEPCCESCLEWRLAWTSAGSRCATLQAVVSKLRADSGTMYARGKDAEAGILRQLANDFEVEHKEASAKLQSFIARDEVERKARMIGEMERRITKI